MFCLQSEVFLRLITCVMLTLILSVSSVFAETDSSSTRARTVTKVTDGIYMIRHKDAPDGFPQGNTTVIIGEREVFVVDACYLPSSAKEDIAQIRQWTDKPVRYLLNTHWHYDHTMGNGTYAEAFPSITIIAHTETRKQMEGYNPGWFQRFPGRADIFRKYIETGKDGNGTPLSDQDKKDYLEYIAGIEPVSAEFKLIRDRMPEMTFEDGIAIDLGNREIQIKHLGKGNTAGDAVVFLPKEKILITGDLLDHPVPYLGGGYPSQFAKTLRKMAQMDVETFIPGHGNVLKGKAYLNLVALAVFMVNAESFPTSPNAYDCLADAYEADGQTALAVTNAQKALDLLAKATNLNENFKNGIRRSAEDKIKRLKK